jgi:uncharacterized protein with GYD domain
MATYILLMNFTDQGIRKVKDSPKRAEAPDDVSMTALGLSSGALGNIRTQTLRAFAEADMRTILSKMVKG